MKSKVLRALLLAMAACAALVVTASPAFAQTFTNPNADGRISGLDSATVQSRLTYAGRTVECNEARFTGIARTGSRTGTGRVAFDTGCRGSGFGVTVRCAGTVTLTIDGGSRESGRVTLDEGFNCSIEVAALAARITCRGRQGPLPEFTYRGTTLRVRVVIACSQDAGATSILLGASTDNRAGFEAAYTIEPSGARIS
jgi:hypothetical protein